jgi:hypothetical protein
MPAIFVITKQAAEMQPDAIEASEVGAYSGVEFMAGLHTLFLLLPYCSLLAIAHIRITNPDPGPGKFLD